MLTSPDVPSAEVAANVALLEAVRKTIANDLVAARQKAPGIKATFPGIVVAGRRPQPNSELATWLRDYNDLIVGSQVRTYDWLLDLALADANWRHMIDEEWLKQLDFVGVGGMRIHGLVGLGAESIVLGSTAPDGRELVTKVRRHHLGLHIREIPLFLSDKPLYDVGRVNKKLLGMIGSSTFDEQTSEYDRMFSSILNILHKMERVDEQSIELTASMVSILLGNRLTPYCPEAIHFGLATPQVARRLGEIASLSAPGENADPREFFPRVNGPNFPIEGVYSSLIAWANTMLKLRQALVPTAPFEPGTLAENPMFIWGAAVMDGFFTDDELPKVTAFIEQNFGPLPNHSKVSVFMEQIDAISHLLAGVLKESKVERFVTLCGMLGFMFEVHDPDGKQVASSMKGFRK